MKGYEVASFAWPDDSEKINSKLILITLNSRATLSKTKIGAKECGLLMLTYITKGGEKVGKELRKDFIDFVSSEDFLPICKKQLGTLNYFLIIMNQICLACYQDKARFLNEIIAKYTVGFFTSAHEISEINKKSLIATSIVIMSGKTDDYLPSLNLLKEKLLDSIRNPEL